MVDLYIYAKSGHAHGLENVRRCAVLAKRLEEFDPILATCDYRAATYAKRVLKVKKAVGIDIFGNLPNMMTRGDILIYDTDEPSDTMTKHMKEYCTASYKVGVDIDDILIDDIFHQRAKIKKDVMMFFGDDDYSNELLKLSEGIDKVDIPLLLGHYFFYKNEPLLQDIFSQTIEDDLYIHTIKSTKYLLCSSVQTALESKMSGNYPVFYHRLDKTVQNTNLIDEFNIPKVKGKNIKQIVDNFYKIISKLQ
ncbi:MAG: hypothetical protein B1H07_03840 [Campylobacteraceae bacterium 4484_166]|nr:MAG: hypothetical protein B1H07_03840 [Campylobacteraceae bacterium 4484_166]